MKLLSNDGQTWYEVTEERYNELLADESADCWVDLSDGNSQLHVRLSLIRHPEKLKVEPGTLFGIPIVVE